MTHKQFYTVFGNALEVPDRDAFVSNWCTSSLFDTSPDGPGPDIDALSGQLGRIWDVAHMTVRDIRDTTGLAQIAFAERFCIPRRTVEGWEYDRTCPDYTRLMMADALGLLDVPRE